MKANIRFVDVNYTCEEWNNLSEEQRDSILRSIRETSKATCIIPNFVRK